MAKHVTRRKGPLDLEPVNYVQQLPPHAAANHAYACCVGRYAFEAKRRAASVTLRTQVERGEVNGRQITVIDTPGQQMLLLCCASLGSCPVPVFNSTQKPAQPASPLPIRNTISLQQTGPGRRGGHIAFRAFTKLSALPTHSRHERRQVCLQRLLPHIGFAWG